MVVVINVDAYPIFGFLKPDLSLWGYKNRCFLVALLWLILKRHIWEKATKSFFASAVTNTRVVLVPCRAWKCVPTASFSGMDILEVTGCYLLKQMNSQWVSQKLLQGSMSQELTVYFSVFSCIDSMKGSKVHKSSNFESHSSLKLSFTIIRGFVLFSLDMNLSSNQALLIFLLYVRQTLRINWFEKFLCKGLPSFNSKAVVTHMNVLQFM